MRDIRCIVGLHVWQAGVDSDQGPFDVCTRRNCGRYRYPDDGRRYDNPYSGGGHSGWSAGGGVGGVGDGGGGGGDG
jgi:hypothetical protein